MALVGDSGLGVEREGSRDSERASGVEAIVLGAALSLLCYKGVRSKRSVDSLVDSLTWLRIDACSEMWNIHLQRVLAARWQVVK